MSDDLADELRHVGYTAPRLAEHRMDVLSDDDRTTVILAATRIEELEAPMSDEPTDVWATEVHGPDGELWVRRDEAADRIAELEAELERTRQAWVNGDDPHCEDVCQIECKGPCGVGSTDE